jgi:hypothetical protein
MSPGVLVAWTAKEFGIAKQLCDLYSFEIVRDAITYVLQNWEERIAPKFKTGGVPTMGLLIKCHSWLIVESQGWSEHQRVIDEWKQWVDENPGSFSPPKDLKERYRKAKQALGM